MAKPPDSTTDLDPPISRFDARAIIRKRQRDHAANPDPNKPTETVRVSLSTSLPDGGTIYRDLYLTFDEIEHILARREAAAAAAGAGKAGSGEAG